MQVWYKADNGIQASLANNANANRWTDSSGNGNDAVQTNSTNQPTKITNAIGSLPALAFNGTSQFLQMPTGFSNFTEGATILAVVKPTGVPSAFAGIVDFGTNSNINSFLLCEPSTTSSAFYVFDGSANSTSASSTLTLSQFQVLEAVHNGAASATAYNNGAAGTPNNSMLNIANVSRNGNFIGQRSLGGLYFQGQIAELLVWNRGLSTNERLAAEAYTYGRYGTGSAPKLPPPTVTPGTGVYVEGSNVSMSTAPGATIYYTLDGTDPVGGTSPQYSSPISITSSTTIKAIAAGTNYTTSDVGATYFQIDANTARLPKLRLQLWLKGDNGAQAALTNGAAVQTWTDSSGNGNHAVQSTSSNRPTLVSSAVNGLPALAFNGTGQFLQLPTGFADFALGASIYAVVKPTGLPNAYARIIDFGTGSNVNSFLLTEPSTSSSAFYVFNSSANSTFASGSLAMSQYQVLEAVQTGTGVATVYNNGSAGTPNSSMYGIANVTRNGNFVGQYSGGGLYFQGELAEILVYSKEHGSSDRLATEAYLYGKYHVGNPPALPAPTVTPGTGIYSASQRVEMAAQPGVNIYYTTNGAQPDQNSNLYTQPITISSTTTLKVIAIGTNYTNSPVTTVYLQIDARTASVRRDDLFLWLAADNGVQASLSNGGSVSTWTDSSTHGNDATQSVSAQRPTFATNAVNGLPAIAFNGTSQYVQLPSNPADFTNGASIFVIAKPTAMPVANTRIIDFGTGAFNGANSFGVGESATNTASMWVFDSSLGNWTRADTTMSLGSYQLLEAVHNGSGTATMYTNGASGTPNTSMLNITSAAKTANYVGVFNGGGFYFQGQIAEVLCYNRPVTSAERKAIEQYAFSKYGLAISAPVITPGTGVYGTSQTVTITADPGATIYYTTDGSQPVAGTSPQYSGPFTLSSSTSPAKPVQAVAVQSFGTSPVTIAYIQIDAATQDVSRSNMVLWIKADNGAQASLANGAAVATWTDSSGSGNDATQSNAASKPTMSLSAVNSLPALSFNGTSHFMQLPSNLASFTSGATVIVVAKPTAVPSTNSRMIDFGTGAFNGSNSFGLGKPSTTSAALFVFDGSGNATSCSTTMTLGSYQIFEAVHNGSGSATAYTNGTAGTPNNSMNNISSVTKTNNYVGQFTSGGFYFQGQIAEIICYNRAITGSERAKLEGYLRSKYALGISPPTISPSVGVFGAQNITITADPGAVIRYTLNGTTPVRRCKVLRLICRPSLRQRSTAARILQRASSRRSSFACLKSSTVKTRPVLR